MARNSKSKGNRYELQIAKTLTKWWGHEFNRVPQSGGLGWERDNRIAGDIVPGPNADFPFTVEAKHREGGWTLESIILGRHDIKNWWAQVVRDSREVDTIPLLMFTRNYAEDFIMIPYKEQIYNDLVEEKQPVMRAAIEYEIELTKQTELFDVLVTTQEGFMGFTPDYWRNVGLEDWDEVTRLSDDIEDVEEDINDTLNKLNDIK